jgi:MYXO-CTERM domain-containing protein
MIDLNTWLNANNPTEGAKWTLNYAYGLSDTGLITGWGWYNDGTTILDRAFLLDASALIPEPGSLALPGLGTLTLLRRRRADAG